MTFIDDTNTILIVGATSGIGKAFADKFHAAGKNLIITGRRVDRLQSIATDLKANYVGSGSAPHVETVEWDIADLKNIGPKIKEIIQLAQAKNLGLNAVIVNSGLQRQTDFTHPEKLDIAEIDVEITTNFTAYVHIVSLFLPYLSSSEVASKKPWIAVLTSGLAFVPLPRTPVYNATKAGLHQFVLGVRAQFDAAQYPVRIVEIVPPLVQTELHDPKNQPDVDDKYRARGMRLDDFISVIWKGLGEGKTTIAAGFAVGFVEKIDGPRLQLLAAITSASEQ